jgi:hypothetical protein
MRFKNSTALLSVSFAALTAAPALADITADDIWTSFQTIAQSVGGELTATITRDGNKVAFSDAKLHFAVPGDKGSLDILYPTLSYTDNADGTVSMDMNGTHTYKLVFTDDDKKSDPVSAEIVLTYDNAELIASGAPDDITFTYGIGSLAFALQNLDLGYLPGSENFPLSMTGHGLNWKGSSQVTLGELLSINGQSEIESMGYVTDQTDENGIQTNTSVSYGDMKNQTKIALPTGGMSFMNLAAALKQGLSFQGSGSISTTSQQTTAVLNGQEVMSANISGGATTSNVSADSDAIDLAANFADLNLDVTAIIEVPIAVKANIERTGAHFRMPVSASDDPQDFTFALAFEGMKLGEEIWAMFDPAEVLPRDPASVSMTLTGQTTLLQDLLNIPELMALDNDDIPLELNALTIKDFLISAAGASLSGTGDFAFNNDDLTSFDGMPAPSGTANLQLNGANGLIDRLIEMGLVQESDAMGARMMMGMMTVPGDGDDSLKSEIEVTEDGQISANGQRIK